MSIASREVLHTVAALASSTLPAAMTSHFASLPCSQRPIPHRMGGGVARITAAVFLAVSLFSIRLAIGAPAVPDQAAVAKLQAEALRTYSQIASAVYDDSVEKAKGLQVQIQKFLDQPSDATLASARQAWIDARKPYLQSETFRFSAGPIEAVENRINAWPIDENYIDYVADDPSAGVINHPERFPEITPPVIQALNEKDGERNISTGYHAIEFLLWGQDQNPNGPGNRSYRDYVVGPDATAQHPERRREYLKVVTEMLVSDLEIVAKAWSASDPDSYQHWLLNKDTETDFALVAILKGIGTFAATELAGERLTVAYETKEQEDEHSCFSDTTHLDVLYDVLGVQNIYYGRYTRTNGEKIEGHCFHYFLSAIQPDLARELAIHVDAAMKAAESIPAPFDTAIQGTDATPARKAIRKTIEELQAQAEPWAKAQKLMMAGKSAERSSSDQ